MTTRWVGKVPQKDDFGDLIGNTFIDGKTVHGPWAIMTPESWIKHGVRMFGTGLGQRYKRQDQDHWFKVEG